MTKTLRGDPGKSADPVRQGDSGKSVDPENIGDSGKRKNLRKTGSRMEEAAAAFLTAHGVEILERNFRSRAAEIDIIGQQDGATIFVEVKARTAGKKSGSASEAVGAAKQRRICRCADLYLHSKGIDPFSACIRFDVVAITMQAGREIIGIRWIKNAFDYVPNTPGRAGRPHWRVW